jgi:multidrug efflux system outer membrane protein
MHRTLLAAALAVALTSGCASLAPDYTRPTAPVSAQWPIGGLQAAEAPQAASHKAIAAPAEMNWEDFFTDPALKRLIALTLANNRDLRVAGLNIEKARAQYQIQRADLFPTINATTSGTQQRVPGSVSSTGQTVISHEYSASLGFAAYELDFFGRIRSLKDQALYQFLATEEARRSVQISLVAEVANAYLTLAADNERLNLAMETWLSQQASYALIKRRFDLGSASALDLHQAQTSVESARVDRARYSGQVAQDRNALVLLAGSELPNDILQASSLESITIGTHIPEGLPSNLLLHRPDVLQAERLLQAANANIGAARAAFFPSISLTASGGTASNELSNLFTAGASAWRFVPQLTLPIFNAGRIQAGLDVAKVQEQISVAQYEKTIQTAFREVADALSVREPLQQQLEAQQAMVEATAASHRLSRARFDKGIDNYLTVLDSQRTAYAAQQNHISVRLASLANQVTFYKVMGGGAH